MQIEELNHLTKLFDVYGKLLSQKQYDVMDKSLNNDIGESELAELFGESRQSVHDAISKAKKQLVLFEEKCGVISANLNLKKDLLKVKALLENSKENEAEALIDNITKSI